MNAAQCKPVEETQGAAELFGHIEDHALARRFKRSVESLRRWLDKDGVEFRRVGGRRFYKLADIQHWMDTGRAPDRMHRRAVRRRLPRVVS